MPSQTQGEVHLADLRSACAELREAVGGRRVSVWIHDEGSSTVSPLVSVADDLPSSDVGRRWSRLPVEMLEGLTRVLYDRCPVLVDDVEAPGIPTAVCRELGVSSAWVAPLDVGDQRLGLLVVEPVAATVAPGLERQVDVVARALSVAKAWYLADQRRAELDLLLALAGDTVEARAGGRAVEHLCRGLAHHLRVARACVFLVDNGRLVATHAHHADGSADREGYRAFTEAAAPAIVDEVFRTRTTAVLHEPNLNMPDGWWLDTCGIGAAVAIPIGTPDGPLGVLTLDDPRRRRFTTPVLALAESAAAQFGVLYEWARLLDDQARSMRAAAAVRQLLREGSAASSPIAATALVARIGKAAVEAEHAVALLVDDDARVVAVETIDIDEPWSSEVKRRCQDVQIGDIPLARMVIERRVPVIVVDASHDELIPSELLEGMPMRSYVAMPLGTSTGVRGAVLFTSSTIQRRWSQGDRMLIEQLMLESDLVLENAALREVEVDRQRELSRRALHDPLTGLPNRALLDDRLTTALQATSRRGGRVAVLFVDLHRFKQVNDRFGHGVGDRVLVELADRFAAAVRPGDTVGRLAGDEFLVVLPGTQRGDAAAVAARICDVAAEPVHAGAAAVAVGASVGVALGDHTDDAAAVVRRADAAMYRVKRERGHGYLVDVPLRGDDG